jgi:hypothetical protein
VQACWLSKELEVRLAARGEEALHLFVFLDGLDDFALVERAGVVLVDEEEDLLRGLRAGPSATRRRAQRLRTPGAVRSGTRQ